jgi:AhpD family alkylhydroperoxidase
LRFAGALTLRGSLPRADAELVILRVGDRCRCEYELGHHRRIAAASGLTHEQIDATTGPADDGIWTSRQRALIHAVDELHDARNLSDAALAELRQCFSGREVIELCMLVGHYEMLAMTLNALRVPPDRVRGRFLLGPALRVISRTGG